MWVWMSERSTEKEGGGERKKERKGEKMLGH